MIATWFPWIPEAVRLWLAAVILGFLATFFAPGCGLFDAHVKEMDTMRGMAVDAASRLQDGSVGQMAVSGQALNPGITVDAYIKYGATAYYTGLAGQFQTSAQGQLSAREAPLYVQQIIMARDLSDAAKLKMIEKWVDAQLAKPVEPPAEPAPTP